MFLHFFLNIDLYFLIPAVIAQIFNPVAKLAVPTGIPNNILALAANNKHN